MNLKIFKILLAFLFGGLFLLGNAFAEGDVKDRKNSLNKPTGSPIRAFMNINNVSTVIKNDGISDIDVGQSNSGLVYPKGSGKTAVFQSGLIWGAFVDPDPQVRMGGSTYATGLQAGRILPDGTAEDDGLDHVRIYRVRPVASPGTIFPTDFFKPEADDEGKSQADVEAQYLLDWQQWPANWSDGTPSGAPFDDRDGDGVYNWDPNGNGVGGELVTNENGDTTYIEDVPGVPGADQTIWFVANDLEPGLTTTLYGAQPLGVEVQATFWAYAQTGALGNMFFRKYKIINKSGTNFRDMYICFWSDVDLGNSTDDFVTVDTVLSLSMSYNANATDPTYTPLPPPTVGFDFFQGPLLDGIAGEDRNKNGVDDAEDFGIFDGKVVGPGKINLPMTAAFYFTRGAADVTDPPLGQIEGSNQMYNFLQGRVGLTGRLFFDPVAQDSTTFVLTGDVPTRQGWIDGLLQGPGDRRQGLSSGPFQMSAGDTQEVVVAEILAGATPGVDRISAIGLNKFYDVQAQLAYDNFFDLPNPPPAPVVSVVELNRNIVLNWGGSQQAVSATENFDSKGFTFQGYNVYQLPNTSAQVSEGVRIATFDIVDGIGKIEDFVFDPTTGSVVKVPVQFGNDTGIQRQISITVDEINQRPVINGIRYYFAVTAYNYNPSLDAIPNNLENPISILTVVPQSKNPGVVNTYDYADTIDVTRNSGASDGNVYPLVVDPTRLTGLQYTVTFDTIPGGTVVWNVDRQEPGGGLTRVLANQTNQNADAESPIVDGIQFRVIGAPEDFKGFFVTANGNGPIDPPVGGALDFAGFPSERPGDDQQVGEGHWAIHTADNGGSDDGGGTRGQYDAFLDRVTRSGNNWAEIIPYDYEMRFTSRGSIAYDAFATVVGTDFVPVPFELWNIGINTPDDPSDDYRMVPFILSNSNGDFTGDALYSLESWGLPSSPGGTGGGQEHSASSADNDPFTDWIYWYRTPDTSPGEAAYLAVEAEMQAGTYDGHNETEVIARSVLINWNGGSAPPFNQDLPEEGTVFRITSTKPNVPGVDVFSFTATAPESDNQLAQSQLNEINVFPNPYYGVNSEEINKYNRFVTFTHLPAQTKVRIFNLAGVLVKVIEKEDAGQFLRWDLANQDGLPVASGLYIAYLELKAADGTDLGTKILKLAIVQEQQILDRF